MKTKKAANVGVEIIVLSDGTCQYIVRTMNGQPVVVVNTPAELVAVFQELSADAVPAGETAPQA